MAEQRGGQSLRTLIPVVALLVCSVLVGSTAQSTQITTGEPPSGNTTSNDTTAAGNVTTVTTPETTTVPKTMTPPTPGSVIPHATDMAFYVLTFTVSRDNQSEIVVEPNVTIATVVSELRDRLLQVASGVIVNPKEDQEGAYEMEILYTLSKWQTDKSAQEVLLNVTLGLGEVPGVSVDVQTVNRSIVQFANRTQDICKAQGICPSGFDCLPGGCRSPCSQRTCSGHGTCRLTWAVDEGVEAACSCDSPYDTEYYGPDCEDSRIGKDKVIAIVAGVLGTVCLLLFVACVVLLLKSRRGSYNTEYALSREGYLNSTYDNTPTK